MSVLRAPVLALKWFAVVLAVLVWIAIVPIIDLLAGALSRIVAFFKGRSANPDGELEVDPVREPVRPSETPEPAPRRSSV